MERRTTLQRNKNGKIIEARYKSYARSCLRCHTDFETIWKRKIYCGRQCYMKGVEERGKEWQKTEEGMIWVKKYRIGLHRRIRMEALAKLGGQCKECGFRDPRALQIDHVNGDGKAERNTRKTMYKNIAKGIGDVSKYQLLCANCNWIKRFANNEGKNHDDYNDFLIFEMNR